MARDSSAYEARRRQATAAGVIDRGDHTPAPPTLDREGPATWRTDRNPMAGTPRHLSASSIASRQPLPTRRTSRVTASSRSPPATSVDRFLPRASSTRCAWTSCPSYWAPEALLRCGPRAAPAAGPRCSDPGQPGASPALPATTQLAIRPTTVTRRLAWAGRFLAALSRRLSHRRGCRQPCCDRSDLARVSSQSWLAGQDRIAGVALSRTSASAEHLKTPGETLGRDGSPWVFPRTPAPQMWR